MAGSDLVGEEARRCIGHTVIRLQTGKHRAIDVISRETFLSGADGLSQKQKGWLGEAVAMTR